MRAKAIFPVIAIHANKSGECWPGKNRIAKLSGMAKDTTDKAFQDLLDAKIICINKPDGKINKKNPIEIVFDDYEDDMSGNIRFYKKIVTSGIWAVLPEKAKVVFLSLLGNMYARMEGNELSHFEVIGKASDIAVWAGISKPTAITAINQLCHITHNGHYLLEHEKLDKDIHKFTYSKDPPQWHWPVNKLNNNKKLKKIREMHYGEYNYH